MHRFVAESATTRAYTPLPRSSAPGTWTKQRIVAALRDWAEAFGQSPRSYEWCPPRGGNSPAGSLVWMHLHPRWPSESTVRNHFSTWSAALEAAGLPTRPAPRGRERDERIHAARGLRRLGLSHATIGDALGVAASTISRYLRAHSCPDCGSAVVTDAERCPRCTVRQWQRSAWTRESVCLMIRRWSRETGASPTARDWLATAEPTKWMSEYPAWPSATTVRTIFGSWNVALAAAGVRPRREPWTRPRVLEALAAFADHSGRAPTTRDLTSPGLPDRRTVQRHCGSWAAALAEAVRR